MLFYIAVWHGVAESNDAELVLESGHEDTVAWVAYRHIDELLHCGVDSQLHRRPVQSNHPDRFFKTTHRSGARFLGAALAG